ncbi:hypothetical protein HGRIS_011932 [Hohenbuehelia grisea]|uniref:Uncharacterized protein n=1 Tax=Hohenbuehelia grisea TaxID=104357 RepID=A0ABR3JXP5_9AGAR
MLPTNKQHVVGGLVRLDQDVGARDQPPVPVADGRDDAVLFAQSFADFKLIVTALDTATGDQLASEIIPSPTFVNSLPSAVAWTDGATLKSFLLDPKLKAKPVAVKGAAFDSIVDLGLREYARFLAVKDDGAARLFKLDTESGGLKAVHEFCSVDASAGAPVLSGGLDKYGNTYVSRIRWSSTLKQAVVDLYSGHLAQGLSTSFTFPFDTLKHGIFSQPSTTLTTLSHHAHPTHPTHTHTHAYTRTFLALPPLHPPHQRPIPNRPPSTAPSPPPSPLARLALTTSSGAIQLWQHD